MPAKPNVLLLFGSFEVGGAEGQLVQLARLLRAEGLYGVHLACLKRRGALLSEAEQLNGGEIPEYPLKSFYDANMVSQLRRFKRYLGEREIDVIHTEGFYTNVFGMIGGALARTPARIAFRGETGGWRTARQNRFERAAFRLAHVVHANALAVKEHLVEGGVPASKIVVIYNGMDMTRVEPAAHLQREEMLEIFGLPREAGRRFVTIVANMRHEVKDHRMFLRAARRVRDAVPEAEFVIAGEGELTDSYRALAAELELESDTFFIGHCERVAELLAVSDVCVLSSKAEGFSNSILEYMAAARPVVVTDVGGAREAVAEGSTGYLVPSGDEEAMAARIVSLLREPERAREMGLRGRLRVEQMFSDARQVEETQKLYERLLARPAALRVESVQREDAKV